MNDLTDIGGVEFSQTCLVSHKRSLLQHHGSDWRSDPRNHAICRKTRELCHGEMVIEGHRIWVFQWEDTFTVMETQLRGYNRRRVEVPRSVTETHDHTVSAPDESTAREVFEAWQDSEVEKRQRSLNLIGYQNLRVTEDPDCFAVISDSICMMDFCGSIGSVRQINMWADYFFSEKLTRFGGAYWEVPNMPSDKPPTDDQLSAWVEAHPTDTMEDLQFKAEHGRTMALLERVRMFCAPLTEDKGLVLTS